MAIDDSWSAAWSCDKLISHTNIATATPVGSNTIQVTLKRGRDEFVNVATMSVDVVTAAEIRRVYTSPDIEFVLNIPKAALFQGDALEMSESLRFGLGGLGDLYVAAAESEFRTYVPKEFRFILRALRQHSHVEDVTRVNNRMLLVKRYEKPDYLVLALNEYDLTADAVRTGIDRFGRPDAILASNPNCQPSSAGGAAAASCGLEIYTFADLMSKLRL